MILTSFLFLFANADTINARITETYIPKGFYGTWGVISKLKTTTNTDLFNYESRDVWVLSGYNDILILENMQTGAKTQIQIKEKNRDGKTLRFERIKNVKQGNEKIIYKEIVSFILNGKNFSGTDVYIIEKYNNQGKLIEKNSGDYEIKGVKISGENP